ncbi:MAG: S8 family serine peptidase [Phycisphaerales bacterium]|nr:S8 family serine peptidase [Phycisphaerales bacterium]
MKIARLVKTICICGPALLAPLAAAQVTDPPVVRDAIVRLRNGVNINDFLASISSTYPGTTVVDDIASRNIYRLSLTEGADPVQVDQFFANLANQPNSMLRWGEAGYEARTAESRTGSVYVSRPASYAAQFETQYPTITLGVTQAQQLSTGRGVAVAILDTGVDASHPAFGAAVRNDGFNTILNNTDTRDIARGVDSNGNSTADEMVGHGTFVAGLVTLVAPETRILPVTVLDSDGVGTTWSIGKGLFYAIDRDVEVINLSLGSTYKAQIFEDAANEAEARGIMIVAAVGNSASTSPARYEYPGQLKETIGVYAVDRNDVLATFTNYGGDSRSLEALVGAPGASTGDPNATIYGPLPGGMYGEWEGTSLSTPLMSGGLALLYAQHPVWGSLPPIDPNDPSDPTTLFETILGTMLPPASVNISAQNPGAGSLLGLGRIDLEALISVGPPQPAPGDINGDGVVDLSDLAQLLADFASTRSTADLTADGIVDLSDLAYLLAHFGH